MQPLTMLFYLQSITNLVVRTLLVHGRYTCTSLTNIIRILQFRITTTIAIGIDRPFVAVRVACFALQLSTFISRLQIDITFTLAAGFGFGDLICITNLKSSLSLLLLLHSLVSILSRGGRKELSVVGRFPTYHRLDACCIAKQPRSNPTPAFLGLQEHFCRWVVNSVIQLVQNF